MKLSKYTESQVVFTLQQAETGSPIDEVCRKIGISEAIFYNRKKKFGGLGPSELLRLRELAQWLIDKYRISIRRATATVLLGRSTFYYRPSQKDDQVLIGSIRGLP